MSAPDLATAWNAVVQKHELEPLPYKHVVMYSGGFGSFCAALRVVEEHGPEKVALLFTDTKIEDASLYVFLEESAAVLGADLHIVADGRTPWEVFEDARFIGNNRVPLCSRVLKQEPARAWVERHFMPDGVTLHIGIDWSEIHRVEPAQKGWAPYQLTAPLCDPPYIDKHDMARIVESYGMEIPTLYTEGFPHNNCGGTCVRAGVSHWKHVLLKRPDRFKEWEENETRLRAKLGDYSILRDRTLKELRESVERGEETPAFDWGGCGCMLILE